MVRRLYKCRIKKSPAPANAIHNAIGGMPVAGMLGAPLWTFDGTWGCWFGGVYRPMRFAGMPSAGLGVNPAVSDVGIPSPLVADSYNTSPLTATGVSRT